MYEVQLCFFTFYNFIIYCTTKNKKNINRWIIVSRTLSMQQVLIIEDFFLIFRTNDFSSYDFVREDGDLN